MLRQPLANHLGLDRRVCGYKLGYQDACDEISQRVFGVPAPRRVRVTGTVQFRGLSGPDHKPAMLRVLCEMSAQELACSLLAADPQQDVTVVGSVSEASET